MNEEPGGNKSFQWRQASMFYTSVPLLSVDLPFLTTEGEAARKIPSLLIKKLVSKNNVHKDNSKERA